MPRDRRKTDSVLRSLGLRVRELRRARGLTQEGAATELGMQAPNYANIEQGRRNVTVNTLVKIANFFGVPVGALFDEPQDKTVRPGRPKKSR